MEVGIRELKQHLSQYVAMARRGESITVTDRGTPVARLEPLEVASPPEALRHLVESGKLIWKPPSRLKPPTLRLTPGEKTMSDFVVEQRR
jgi:prevent-host-death family protein